MEIERKYLVSDIPYDLDTLKCRFIEQGYLTTNPVVRVRQDNDKYYLTYKGGGMMCREEYNLPLNKESYSTLIGKSEGNIITKKRYEIPFKPEFTDSSVNLEELVIELDIFEGVFAGIILAEVEFPTIQAANSFVPPSWFTKDVTEDGTYHNSNMSKRKMETL